MYVPMLAIVGDGLLVYTRSAELKPRRKRCALIGIIVSFLPDHGQAFPKQSGEPCRISMVATDS